MLCALPGEENIITGSAPEDHVREKRISSGVKYTVMLKMAHK